MNFEEHAAKPLLRAAGIETPKGTVANMPEEAARIASEIGPCVVKAQVPIGKRGKAGGIALANSSSAVEEQAARILAMKIDGHRVGKLLVEQQVAIAQEMYAAVLNDPASKAPLLLFSAEGGMDIEEIAEKHPDALLRLPVDIRHGINRRELDVALANIGGRHREKLTDLLNCLYQVYADNDAELVEINPLVRTSDGQLVALDCKFTLDDSAIVRHANLAKFGTPDQLTRLEARAKAADLKFIELDGTVGVLANGAGLTMTTMDAIRHYGGQPANFLEIGGEAYTKGREALEVVLANPRVKSLLVNFCGAFARTDVMTEGILNAWEEMAPDLPVFFTIHGTGEEEAVAMVRDRLKLEPFDFMDDAVKAAVEAAQ